MMELRHLAMVNWHLFDIEDIEVGGHIGVLGENRSGKSTVLDMAQVVLTGANKNFMRLNAVAGDGAGSRGGSPKRSVLGYCLGALGENEMRREEARTYIALGFEDADGVRPPVTIGLALEARTAESSETVLGRFVVVGKILKTADFVESRDHRRYPARWDDVRTNIIAAVGHDCFANHRDRPTDYVREYMRHLVPHLPCGEHNAAALQKAIVNAMTLNQNYTATQFVRRFVLEDNPIRVGELRESIQTYRNINATIVTMRRKLDALKGLQTLLSAFAQTLHRKALETWIAARADWLAARAAYRDITEKLQLERARRDAASSELMRLDQEIDTIGQELDRLNVAIAEHDARTGRETLRERRRSAELSASRAESELRRRIEMIGRLKPLIDARRFAFGAHLGAIDALCILADETHPGRMPEGLAAVEAAAIAAARAILNLVDEARQRLFREVSEKREALLAIKQRIERHASGQSAAHLDDSTERLCRRLRQLGMAPRVLCDLVEIADAEWTAAAEGLLGRDREAVFVDREHLGSATAIFKEERREFARAALVSLNKLESSRMPPQPGTFPTIFRSQDQDAIAFIVRRYGSVRLADTLAQFDAPGRAIMKDGLYDDGLVRTHRSVSPRDYKIGKAAQTSVLRRLHEEANDVAEVLARTDAAAKEMDAAYRAVSELAGTDQDGDLAALCSAYERCLAEKAQTEERIAALDGAGDGGLRERFGVQQALKKLRTEERKQQDSELRKRLGEVAVLERRLGDGENVPGSRLNVRAVWSIFLKNLPLFDGAQGRAVYRERLGAKRRNEVERHRSIAAKARDDVAAADQERQSGELRTRNDLKDFFNEFGVSSQVGSESGLLSEVKPWVDALADDIESNELRRYERQAREAAERAATLLRGEFINALTARISKMERELQSMNRSLQEHPFHHERYAFHRTAVAEFQPILKVIEISKTSSEALDMLFRGDVPEDFPHRDTLAALEALLEDPEKDFSQFEDYRNFYNFEIHMQDVVTQRTTRWETRRGTGSGAEQQVPIYVAIGASLASVYGTAHHRSVHPSGLALAIFDEAFSKMDGKNQRQMMGFYKDLGLQIVIAAPFEKRVAVLEHMETIVEIDRIGEQSRASVVLLKERARRELMAMNPDVATDAELATRLAAE
ncbi:MAG TPA: SbcC/MukB-like Walker B domain-containing protein [Xanthobacteraceae bacterium]|nr:SbcC/MukB-like Walker B domain-containing protein [Xanthobacteraceae bacterium]